MAGWAGQEAVLLRETAEKPRVIGWAALPLLLRLRQAGPRQQQHVWQSSTHEDVTLGQKQHTLHHKQIQTEPSTNCATLSCFPKTDRYKPTSWGNLWLWFSVIRLKMFCTAGSDTRNTGRTVVAMETRRWHADKSNFSGTCGTQRSGRLAFSQSQRMRKNGLNKINLTI